MKLVDVHCHLTHEMYKNNIKEVIVRAKKKGIKAILVSGVNPAENRKIIEFCRQDEILKPSLGIYPIDALGLSKGDTGLKRNEGKIDLDKEFKFIEENLNQIYAIGEIGMDFYWDKEHHIKQEENFRKIIRFAIKVKKPIVIHSRKAEKECIQILSQEIKNNEIPVIQHCFSGNKKLIKQSLELGHYFSIPPVIVRLQHFQMLVEMVPIEQLLTETDAPWLSPVQEEKNEPAYVIESIKKIAEIKGISIKETADAIWKNFEKIFL